MVKRERPVWRPGLREVVVFAGFLLIAAFFLFEEHRAHMLGLLPYALLALCPLLHVFMHGGHGGHEGPGEDGR